MKHLFLEARLSITFICILLLAGVPVQAEFTRNLTGEYINNSQLQKLKKKITIMQPSMQNTQYTRLPV